ncbi:MAG: YfiR family protein [Bacteroidota bacterium]
MKRTFLYSLFCGAMLCGMLNHGFAQTSDYDTNSKIQALFIHSFLKYVEWPPGSTSGTFTIGIYGEYPSLFNELSTMASKKSTTNLKIEVVNYLRISQLQNCEILYVTAGDISDMPDIKAKLGKSATLTITDQPEGTNSGAGINFYYQEGKQKMEIFTKNIEPQNLKVSSSLKAITKINE